MGFQYLASLFYYNGKVTRSYIFAFKHWTTLNLYPSLVVLREINIPFSDISNGITWSEHSWWTWLGSSHEYFQFWWGLIACKLDGGWQLHQTASLGWYHCVKLTTASGGWEHINMKLEKLVLLLYSEDFHVLAKYYLVAIKIQTGFELESNP